MKQEFRQTDKSRFEMFFRNQILSFFLIFIGNETNRIETVVSHFFSVEAKVVGDSFDRTLSEQTSLASASSTLSSSSEVESSQPPMSAKLEKIEGVMIADTLQIGRQSRDDDDGVDDHADVNLADNNWTQSY